MSYEVKLPQFEGPFDLLLFFIKRDELDIYDIPISQVVADFLDYIHQLDNMNIEVSSEFILMASTLMKIKSRMLLPRPELNEFGDEVDPREELIQHMLAYKKYKNVVPLFAEMEDNQQKKYKRYQAEKELKSIAARHDVESELAHLNLFKILKTYQRLSIRFKGEKVRPIHQVKPYPYSIYEQKRMIMKEILSKEKVSFYDLINTNSDKIFIIFNFLSILELLQLENITILIGEGYNNFLICSKKRQSNDSILQKK